MFPPVATRESFVRRFAFRRAALSLLAGMWCSLCPPVCADLPPLVVWVAEKKDDGVVALKGYLEGETVAVPPELVRARWRRFDLRAQPPNRSGLPEAVVEVRGYFPRIQVRSEYQIIAFSSRADDPVDRVEGIAAVGPWGARVLLAEHGDRFEVEEDGAAVSPDQRFLAIMVCGTRQRELFVFDLQPGAPTVEAVELPSGIHRLLSKSLTLIDGALFFVAELPDDDRVVLRAPLESEEGRSLTAEIVSLPFHEVEPVMAYSPAAVAYLAGPDDDELDVYVARATGASVNLTRCPMPYLEHRWDNQRLAVSDDGGAVGYSLQVAEGDLEQLEEYGPERETFCHLTAIPGMDGRVHITSDERFEAYVEQEALIFFRGKLNMVFAAGHVGQRDVFMFSAVTDDVTNLTRTAGNAIPYGLGTLTPREATVTTAGMMLIAADGFDDGQPGIVGVSADTGEQAFKQLGLENATAFFDVGDDSYFVATTSGPSTGTPAGETLGLYQIRGGSLSRVFSTELSRESRLLLHDPGRALVHVEDEGVLELRPGEPPTTVIAGDVRPAVALSPCGDRLVFSRDEDVYVQDVTGGGGPRRLETSSRTKDVLAVGEAFVRGDVDGDWEITFKDTIALLEHLSLTRLAACQDAADANDDGSVTVADLVDVANQTHRPVVPLPPPFPDPGVDPTPDSLTCCR